jgi:hypothetical protein
MEGILFVGSDLSAFRGSRIAPDTIAAYLNTNYGILEPCPQVLRIGRRHHGLLALLTGHRLDAAAVLTAWNPFSKPRSRKVNERAQAKLVADLDARGLPHFRGWGADPLGKWPAEESRLVLGLDLAAAASLGRQFDQNGIVWAGDDGLPMLVLLR